MIIKKLQNTDKPSDTHTHTIFRPHGLEELVLLQMSKPPKARAAATSHLRSIPVDGGSLFFPLSL